MNRPQRRAHVWLWTLLALMVIAAFTLSIEARVRTDALRTLAAAQGAG